jgi:hypothetical protein
MSGNKNHNKTTGVLPNARAVIGQKNNLNESM